MANDPRKLILARRAKFIAAAFAGAGLVACTKEPRVCLSIEQVPQDAGPADAEPQVCLSPDPNPPTSTSGPPPMDGPPPMACLSVQESPRDAGKPKGKAK